MPLTVETEHFSFCWQADSLPALMMTGYFSMIVQSPSRDCDSIESDEHGVSRTVQDYEYIETDKWMNNIHNQRHFERSAIPEVLEHGEVERAKDAGDGKSRFKFVVDIGGREWWMVVEPRETGADKLVTAYCPEFNRDWDLYSKHYR